MILDQRGIQTASKEEEAKDADVRLVREDSIRAGPPHLRYEEQGILEDGAFPFGPFLLLAASFLLEN